MTYSEAAIARGVCGFLKPRHRHVIKVLFGPRKTGTMYDGHNRREAERTARRWTKYGRKVTFTTDGKLHQPNTNQ